MKVSKMEKQKKADLTIIVKPEFGRGEGMLETAKYWIDELEKEYGGNHTLSIKIEIR